MDAKQTKELNHFLENEKGRFVGWLKKRFSFSDEVAEDIFQEASITLYLCLQNGKIQEPSAPYFWRIGINLSRKALRDNPPFESLDNRQYDSGKIEELLSWNQEGLTRGQSALMREMVSRLPHPCEEILWSFYGDGMSLADIAVMLGYKNAAVVKTTKGNCMQKLKMTFDRKKEEMFYDED